MGSGGYSELDGPKPIWKNPKLWVAIGFVTVVIVVIIVIVTTTKSSHVDTPISLAESLDQTLLFSYLTALQEIGNTYTSRTALSGYNASLEYIQNRLSETNYKTYTQELNFTFFSENAPPQLSQIAPGQVTYKWKVDFQNMRYASSGNISGTVQYVGTGCNQSDFIGFIPSNIALIARDFLNCPMSLKISNAIVAGAIGALVYYDPGTTGLFSGGLKPEMNIIPILTLTYDLGIQFSVLTDLQVSIFADNSGPVVPTLNLIAETPTGDPNNIVILGAHLDSVPAGPGINDDGSGTCTNLAIAITMYRTGFKPKNQVRFAWWAAEEFGLIGSTYYVNYLKDNEPEELAKIAANLNYDMLGSPNYVVAVYNGSGAASEIRNQSEVIQQVHQAYLTSQKQPFILTPFDGRSDYGPFIANGIPAGGLFAGAEQIKTMEQRKMFGGYANAAYDPCYHQPCDTIENINKEGLNIMSRCAAYTTQILAEQDNLRGFLSAGPT